jgi:7-cyano-7-deazaguanine synthase in queuosine biosynthesis
MIEIPFESAWKRIAVSVSGGADSALLAYLLCQKVIDQEVHVINHIRCWKTKPWQEYDSKRIYNWLVDRFPDITFYRHVNFISPDLEYGNRGPIITDEYGKHVSGDNAEQRSFAEYICHKHNIDCYYNGVTRNPRNENFGGMPERDLEKTQDNQHLEFMQHMGRFAAHPFRFISKDEIIDEYKKQNVVELFNITRSCEGTFDWLDYRNYKDGDLVPTCGECFWCRERDWAVDQSNR